MVAKSKPDSCIYCSGKKLLFSTSTMMTMAKDYYMTQTKGGKK